MKQEDKCGADALLTELLKMIFYVCSLVPRLHPVHISSIMHTILKAIHAGVGFGSGTKTSMYVHRMSLKTSLYIADETLKTSEFDSEIDLIYQQNLALREL